MRALYALCAPLFPNCFKLACQCFAIDFFAVEKLVIFKHQPTKM